MENKRIFISHINEEKSIAKVLNEWIESTFLGQCDVFLSSDIDDIPAGNQWFDDIDKALNESNLLIVLCSKNSISRPWINFEAGCGWIKKVPIISICYLGITKSTLPEPLSRFQNLDLDDGNFISDLFSSFKSHFNIPKMPIIDMDKMRSELSTALQQVEPTLTILEDEKSEDTDIPSEAVKILELLSKSEERQWLNAGGISHYFEFNREKIKYFLDILIDHDLIHPHYSFLEPTSYSLNSNGREYLVNHDLL